MELKNGMNDFYFIKRQIKVTCMNVEMGGIH